MNKIWLEKLHYNIGQFININKIIYKKKTKYQKIFIVNNKKIGNILILDNIIQTTEFDEFIYHEMICLIPLFSHPNPKKILIIGGGDGGCLKQITKFKKIQSITLVEIDKKIISCSKKYLFQIHKNSFNDPRVKIIYKNGIKFIKNNKKKFDIIIIDGTDPVGPGKKLFSKKFYLNCNKSLSKKGIIVSQSGTILQIKQSLKNLNKIKKIFKYSGFYQSSVPTYYGGNIFFIWASKKYNLKKIDKNKLIHKINSYKFNYYNLMIHINSFALPQFIIKKLN